MIAFGTEAITKCALLPVEENSAKHCLHQTGLWVFLVTLAGVPVQIATLGSSIVAEYANCSGTVGENAMCKVQNTTAKQNTCYLVAVSSAVDSVNPRTEVQVAQTASDHRSDGSGTSAPVPCTNTVVQQLSDAIRALCRFLRGSLMISAIALSLTVPKHAQNTIQCVVHIATNALPKPTESFQLTFAGSGL